MSKTDKSKKYKGGEYKTLNEHKHKSNSNNDKSNSNNDHKSNSNHKIRNIREFKHLISKNKRYGKDWYHGLEGKWWWGMTEDSAINYIERGLVPEIEFDRIVLVSTWNVNCGIATYTKYLWESLSKIAPNSFVVNPFNGGNLKHKIKGGLTHLQHEFGIIPDTLPKIKGKLIITWHTLPRQKDNNIIKKIESNYDVVAHIVHSECARSNIDSSKDIWTVPHGSTLIPEMQKDEARRLLGMNTNAPIGFVFGFQSFDKNYHRLIEVARSTGIHIIISGASHNNVDPPIRIFNDMNVTFINRFLTEHEVNLYALASDILLFDYIGREHYSVSGALHRIVGAGRPIICSDVRHFNDMIHEKNCLKFKDHEKLKECIIHALKDPEYLSIAAKEYAEKTSWEKIAKKHIDIYKKYIDWKIYDAMDLEE